MTMTSKHTPGPWRYERANASPTTGEHMIAGGKPGYLAEVRDCGTGCVRANARLIAAAPDLLEALEFVDLLLTSAAQNGPNSKPPMKDLNRMMDAATSAIAKARGED